MLDSQCMDILNCVSDCEPTDAESGFTCGMGSEAGKNPHFVSLLHGGEPVLSYEESGACLAEDSDVDLRGQQLSLVIWSGSMAPTSNPILDYNAMEPLS